MSGPLVGPVLEYVEAGLFAREGWSAASPGVAGHSASKLGALGLRDLCAASFGTPGGEFMGGDSEGSVQVPVIPLESHADLDIGHRLKP